MFYLLFFSTTPVILKQFGLEHFSWSSSWLSNESTCYWRDGTFSNWISEICYLNDSWLSVIETAFWVAISSFERNFYRVSNACKSLLVVLITGTTSITQSAEVCIVSHRSTCTSITFTEQLILSISILLFIICHLVN